MTREPNAPDNDLEHPTIDITEHQANSLGYGGILLSIIGTILVIGIVLFLARNLIIQTLIPPTPTTNPVAAAPISLPSPTPKITTGPMVIKQIQQLSRLETSAYSVQTVVTVEKPGNIIGIGSEKLLLLVHGSVVAGIDLSEMQLKDVTVSADGKHIKLRLPAAQIFSNRLDQDRTELYDDRTSLFTKPDPNLVIEAQKQGAQKILAAACEDGILNQATQQSQQAVEQLLAFAGFEQIEFEETPVPSCPASANATP